MAGGIDHDARGERFEIRRRLGAGGMGVVYEAYDRERKAVVALKTLRSVDPRALYQFKQEFRALADLSHPNLVVLHELVSIGDEWLFTMELVDGEDFVAWVCPGRTLISGLAPALVTPSPGGFTTAVDEVTGPTRPGLGRPGPTARPARFDEARLRAALLQLAQGVQALHDAGKLHRDLKPSNVLVTGAGRVVVCDFGLVADVHDAALERTGEDVVAGTPRFMSPEQALAMPQGPPSDWYAVGAILYTALVGRAPHAGTLGDPIARQLADDPPAPSTLVEGVPADLDQLCAALLARDPARRPTGAQVLAALGAASAPAPEPARGAPAAFVGRRRELAALEAAHDDARRGHAVTVLVHGPSGIGKSALVRAFLDGVAARTPEAVILAGRCWERESMPYKAVDALVDALSGQLLRWPEDEVEAILPPDVNLLARLFPVLRRVEAVSAPLLRGFAIPDPHETRRRAFAALRTMLASLGARRPVVLWIDDLQWGDADSAPLLSQLLRPPDAPALLLVASYREGDAGTGPLVAALRPDASLGAVDVRELDVGAMPPADARALAHACLGGDDDERAARVAKEAGGSPFFVTELARHKADGAAAGSATLDEVLAHRLARLSADAMALLEIVALAGRPLPRGLVMAVSRLERAAAAEAMARLRSEHMVRTAGVRDADSVEPYHDRIREHVVRRLSDDAARELHRRLAVVLSVQEGADPEELLEHWAAAGDVARAAEHAEQAAEQAARALAFDRAARLWERTLGLARPEGADARRVLTRLGDALANAGRGAEAAKRYHEAAVDAGPAEALELRRRAAEQLMHSGHFEEGVAAAVEVLAAVDIALASSPMRALPGLLWKRTLLRLRGLKFKERDQSEISPAALTRLDACWSVASGLSCIDTIRGADTQSRHLLLALRTGEPYRVARSLGLEASYISTGGRPARARSLAMTELATAVARKTDNPHALGVIAATAGVAAFLAGEWREAAEKCTSAEKYLRERCTGVHWELDSVQFFGLGARYYLGELGHLVRRVPQLLAEAEERGDLYAATGLASWRTNAAWLVMDDPEGARRAVEQAMERWTKRSFHVQHYYELLALAQNSLYLGNGAAAWDRVAAVWPALSRSLLRRVQNLRIEASCLRARAALAVAEPGAADAVKRLAVAEADARDVEKEQAPWALPLVQLLRAGVAARRGKSADAVARLEQAITAFEAQGMALHATAARARLGALVGGTRGQELAAEVATWMTREGVRAPARFVAMLAPGFE